MELQYSIFMERELLDSHNHLAKKAKSGNLLALKQLVQDFLPFIYRLHFRISLDPMDAEKFLFKTIRNLLPAFPQYNEEKETFRAFLIRLTLFCRTNEAKLDEVESIPFTPSQNHQMQNSSFFETQSWQKSPLFKMLANLDQVGRILFTLIRLEKVPIKEVELALSLDHQFVVNKLIEVNDLLANDHYFTE